MAAIRAKDTKPELIVRKLLHAAGFRYRLHRKDLPGTPDLTLRKWNAVIEVQGCFWHVHECHLFKRPADNSDFWSEKLGRNADRDVRNAQAIAELGMRRLILWECALKGPTKLDPRILTARITDWLIGSESTGEIGSDTRLSAGV